MEKFLRHSLYLALVVLNILIFVPRTCSETFGKLNEYRRPGLPAKFLPGEYPCRAFIVAIALADTTPSIADFDYFISNKGSNRNNGRSAASPQLHIDSVETLLKQLALSNKHASLGLDATSIFREQLDVGSDNINVNSYHLTDGKRFAKITGMDVIRDWKASTANANVYEHLLKHSIETDHPKYNYIVVAEIDTVLEKTSPVAAVKYLALAADPATCSKVAGTYYIGPLTSSPSLVSIHPTQGVPGSTKYRYEVTTRNYGINGYDLNGATYENLFLQSSGHGYGMLSGGDNTTAKNIIFQGGSTHHAVIKSGRVDSCMFLPGPDVNGIALTFYEKVGAGNVSTLSNSVFLDIPNPFSCHVNEGDRNHQKVTVDNVKIFNNLPNSYAAVYVSNLDSFTARNAYIENYKVGYSSGAAITSIKNSTFRNIGQAGIMVYPQRPAPNDIEVSNVLITSNGTDNNNYGDKFPFCIRAPFSYTNADITNTIFHGRSTWHHEGNTIKTFMVGGYLNAHRNVYICDVNDGNGLYVTNANNSNGIRSATNIKSDSNVYILLRGSGFRWDVAPNNDGFPEISTLSRWQLLTGQDKNSILIDLRNDPAGLKTIFVDPEHGNWTLTQTPQANEIRRLSAGMTTPTLFYPIRPPVDNTTPFQTPGGYSSFSGTLESDSLALLEWKTFNESQFDSFELEYSTDSTNFMPIGTVRAISDGNNNNYQFVHTMTVLSPFNYYRLRLIGKDNTNDYSSVISLQRDYYDGIKLVVYPNPVSTSLTVRHPGRDVATISMYDFSGRKLRTWNIGAGITKSSLALNNLPTGMYVIQWTSSNERLTTTIIR